MHGISLQPSAVSTTPPIRSEELHHNLLVSKSTDAKLPVTASTALAPLLTFCHRRVSIVSTEVRPSVHHCGFSRSDTVPWFVGVAGGASETAARHRDGPPLPLHSFLDLLRTDYVTDSTEVVHCWRIATGPPSVPVLGRVRSCSHQAAAMLSRWTVARCRVVGTCWEWLTSPIAPSICVSLCGR